MSSKTFDNTKINVEFDEDYQSRININSGENISSLFAKIRRFILDLKSVAFSGSYNDLRDTPDVVTKEYLDPIKSQAAINKSTLGTQCKNLLKHTAVTTTINGITFTVNADGTITAKGTATANAIFKFATLTLKAGTYKYSGISIAPSTSTANMSVFRTSDWVGLCALAEKNSFTITADTKIECRAVIYSGYTANNVVFYPMIRYADITDDTYEPYKESIDERITNNVSDIAINKSTLGYQCKNLLKIVPRTITSGGVTCVIDDNGIVTVNGTASKTVFINIRSNISLDETLEYTLTGTYDNSSYGYIYYQLGETTGGNNRYNDFGNGVTFKGTYGSVSLRIPVGAVLNNVKYYPMLRYADITDSTYEPYKPSLQDQINNFGTQQQLLCDYSSAATSSVTIQITGLFSNYSAVICTVKYYLGTTSITLPLKYIKSIGKSKEYSPVLDLGFRYVDDNNLLIGGADAAISSVKIISLY